jgi:hypothetical protein
LKTRKVFLLKILNRHIKKQKNYTAINGSTLSLRFKIDLIMNNNEEHTENRSRDWLVFGASTILMFALLVMAPQWIWVAFPFQFTALAGAMGRL